MKETDNDYRRLVADLMERATMTGDLYHSLDMFDTYKEKFEEICFGVRNLEVRLMHGRSAADYASRQLFCPPGLVAQLIQMSTSSSASVPVGRLNYLGLVSLWPSRQWHCFEDPNLDESVVVVVLSSDIGRYLQPSPPASEIEPLSGILNIAKVVSRISNCVTIE